MIKSALRLLAAVALMLACALGLAACADDSPLSGGHGIGIDPSSGGVEDPDVIIVKPEIEPVPAFAVCEWEGYAGQLAVRFVGAELFTDVHGEQSLRVYFDFHNDGENEISTSWDGELNDALLTQDGVELDVAFAYEDVAEYGNERMNVRPGHAIRCVDERKVSAEGGLVTVALYSFASDAPIFTYDLDLANLPGAPVDALVNAAEDKPPWLAQWPAEGVYQDEFYVAIKGGEVVEGWDGFPVLRVFMEFTNNSDIATSAEWTLLWNRGYQDGVQLWPGVPQVSVETDGNYLIDVEPGQTVSVSYCYALNGMGPVEVELADVWEGDAGSSYTGIGSVIKVQEVMLTFFEYSYRGSSADSFVSYTAVREGGKARLMAEFLTRENVDVFADEMILVDLAMIVEEYGMYAWSGFDESNDMVLDGSSFSLSFIDMDGVLVNAHGNNAFPGGFGEAEAAVVDCFERYLV